MTVTGQLPVNSEAGDVDAAAAAAAAIPTTTVPPLGPQPDHLVPPPPAKKLLRSTSASHHHSASTAARPPLPSLLPRSSSVSYARWSGPGSGLHSPSIEEETPAPRQESSPRRWDPRGTRSGERGGVHVHVPPASASASSPASPSVGAPHPAGLTSQERLIRAMTLTRRCAADWAPRKPPFVSPGA